MGVGCADCGTLEQLLSIVLALVLLPLYLTSECILATVSCVPLETCMPVPRQQTTAQMFHWLRLSPWEGRVQGPYQQQCQLQTPPCCPIETQPRTAPGYGMVFCLDKQNI